MRLPDSPSRVWRCIPILLLSAFLLLAPPAAGQELSLPQSHLTPDVRSRLTEAARDVSLAPWQRDFMLGVTADDGDWTEVRPPSARYQHTAIYDPVRDRMVVFGGIDRGYLDDVWALSLAGTPAWSALTPAGNPPPARSSHTAFYDPVLDRMVVFGGYDDVSPRNDVWALSLAGNPVWSALAPTGNPPSARLEHAAIYDPLRNRMVVFGGYDGDTLRNDVWALSLGGSPAWSTLAAAGSRPTGRSNHTAFYDPVRDRMVVFGGYDGDTLRNDVWTLSLGGSPAWSTLAVAGGSPTGRSDHTAIYDPVRDRMVVFGGFDGDSLRSDGWELSLAGSPAWSALAPAGSPPPALFQHTALYDPVRDRMVVCGGDDDGSRLHEGWSLSLAGSPVWSTLAPARSTPPARYFHSAIYDPVRDRMVVFGGFDGNVPSYRNDVWALSLAGNPLWSPLAPTGTPPPARIWHTAIYDSVRDRMVVFGGYDGTGLRNDVWVLSFAGSPAWSALAPAGSPPTPRYSPTAIYDPLRDRMVMFGGNDGISLRNDVWALSFSGSPTWSAVAAASPPSARYQHTAIYDSVRDRMVVFGGYDGGDPVDDVWALSLAGSPAWSALAPAGNPPPARFQHTATYDPVRDRMVVFGGNDDSSLRNDVWALSLGGSPGWSALAPASSSPSGRSEHTAIYDPVRDRMVVFGGYGGVYRNDVWALVWSAPPLPPPDDDDGDLPQTLELGRPRPNPSEGETFVDFDLGVGARVVLDVFDAQGRRVKRIADEWFTAGHHVSSWRGDDESEHAMESGVYFIRMQVGDAQATRRTVRVR